MRKQKKAHGIQGNSKLSEYSRKHRDYRENTGNTEKTLGKHREYKENTGKHAGTCNRYHDIRNK